MDAANTVRIPRDVVSQADPADTTQVLPSAGQQPQRPIRQRLEPQHSGWPTEDYGQEQQDLPPNPYHAQRGPDQFGPLGSQATQQYYPY